MKTKNFIWLLTVLAFTTTLSVTSCKKKKDKEKIDPTSLTQLSKDENDVQNASDDAANDASDVMSRNSNSKSIEGILCGATVDSSTIAIVNDTITYNIVYSGVICKGKKKTGTVQVTRKVGAHWRDAGAILHLKFINLVITKIASNRSIKLNGYKTLTNVSGGVVRELNGTGSVVHTVTGSLTSEFDNGTSRIWNVSRKRTFTGTQGNLILTVEGTGTSGSYNNLVTWGTNRHGEEFYTQITTPIVHKQACDWDPTSGVKIHQIPSGEKKATITFGFDAAGNAVTGSNCPTHCKVEWQKGENTGTIMHAI